jgi:hypothetical protein
MEGTKDTGPGCPWKHPEHGCGTVDCANHGQDPRTCPRWDAEQPAKITQPPDRIRRKTCPHLLTAVIESRGNRDHALCLQSECQMWGTTYTTENISVSDCRLVDRSWVREV